VPHFCQTDFADVITDLRAAGYPFQADWFSRRISNSALPRIGDLARATSRRAGTARRPWHVPARKAAAAGTVRYVDSSLERLQ